VAAQLVLERSRQLVLLRRGGTIIDVNGFTNFDKLRHGVHLSRRPLSCRHTFCVNPETPLYRPIRDVHPLDDGAQGIRSVVGSSENGRSVCVSLRFIIWSASVLACLIGGSQQVQLSIPVHVYVQYIGP